VSRRKEALRELEAAKAEVLSLRGAAGAAARLMAEMQVSIWQRAHISYSHCMPCVVSRLRQTSQIHIISYH